jgi:hypothetical protein
MSHTESLPSSQWVGEEEEVNRREAPAHGSIHQITSF